MRIGLVGVVGVGAGLLLAVACTGGGGASTCGPAECAGVCPPAAPADAVTLDASEKALFMPLIEDVRQGIRPWNDQAIGICKGSGRDCTEFLGASPAGELPEGEYMVRAELRVPKTGEKGTWKVKFDTQCKITKIGENGSTSEQSNQSSREYEVQYVGEERGSRLSPLFTIKSPSPYGAQACTYTLSAGTQSWTGAWSVPAANK